MESSTGEVQQPHVLHDMRFQLLVSPVPSDCLSGAHPTRLLTGWKLRRCRVLRSLEHLPKLGLRLGP